MRPRLPPFRFYEGDDGLELDYVMGGLGGERRYYVCGCVRRYTPGIGNGPFTAGTHLDLEDSEYPVHTYCPCHEPDVMKRALYTMRWRLHMQVAEFERDMAPIQWESPPLVYLAPPPIPYWALALGALNAGAPKEEVDELLRKSAKAGGAGP